MLKTTFCQLALALAAMSACRRTAQPPAQRTADPVIAVDVPAAVDAVPMVFSPPASASEFRDAARIFPQNSIGQLVQSGPVVHASGANLFQVIDGDAVSYQAYNVRAYAKADYRVPNSTLVATVTAYEFSSNVNAFGRFSAALASNRDPAAMQAQDAHIGAAGFLGRTQLVFCLGAFLLQIDMADEDESADENALYAAARTHLVAIGQAVAHNISAPAVVPAHPLVSEGLVWGGATYVADSAFGVRGSGPAWIGWYASPQHARYRVAHFDNATAAAARQLVQKFHRTGATSLVNPQAEELFAVTLEGEGELVVARQGARVAIVADAGFDGATSIDRAAKIVAAVAQLRAASATVTGANSPVQ